MEDSKTATFFKITDAIVELGGLALVWYSSLIYANDLESSMSKLKDKWVEEFDSMSKFSEERIKTWIIDYVNLNNNLLIIVTETREEILDIEN